MNRSQGHTFHIPVLGVAFSVDAPLKVAKYGISSVMSLVDDTLMEQLRKHYQEKSGIAFLPIEDSEEDARAKRVTEYLNMINRMVKEQFEELKNSPFETGSGITKYFEMLPDSSGLKLKYLEMLDADDEAVRLSMQLNLREEIFPGSIDVNIMTKLDKGNYDSNNNPLPSEYNDAHASLRGFANSDLESSIIFSAGMNPKLYSHAELYKDFYPDENCVFKKKIVIKVSDYRSALIQGKFLAKKGLWISEFRIESGLNCGGHAFATDGLLLGPILQEFKDKKDELMNELKAIYLPALLKKEIIIDDEKLVYDVTVQGGVGKSTEQDFLLRYYGVKSVGWGSPFLLVPEVMNVDDYTLQKLSDAKEEDLYLSDISPLGVPFNSLRGNTKDLEKMERVANGKPGSPCPKKFLISNKDYSDKPLCTASITFINKKIAELKNSNLYENEYQKQFDKIVNKVCLCEGLTVPALIVNNIETPKQSRAVSVCPGPNLAYFSKIVKLKEMVDHIYGKINLITHPNRPNMFVKELDLYISFLQKKMSEIVDTVSPKEEEFFNFFTSNLVDGISYYNKIIPELTEETEAEREKIRNDFEEMEQKLLAVFSVPV
ncbi:MAG: hypothetical protein CVV24_09945 [Ignavibacteriae bacterium HGW-Ignavibacteriae-3]|nr:MAG: hypothetical protein CVV24_09945 [Ignavibacteriae bacterium HGW-Ignavibacteriae-3]